MHRRLASSLVTDVPGSSEYLLGSAVTYSNMAKHKLINVSEESLEAYGAVSWQVACEMAQGVRELFGTTYGVGITGIAARAEQLKINLSGLYIWPLPMLTA